MGFAILHLLPFFALLSLFFWSKRLFVLQIVQFSRTWCSNHFVSYFEIQILHVSKFFNDFRGNRNLQKMRKKEKEERKEAQPKQRTKNEKPMRPSFLHASAILFSSVLVHLCVVNSTVNEWSNSTPWWSARRVAKSRRQENFVNTPACFVNTFSLEFARGRAASHPSLAYIVNQASVRSDRAALYLLRKTARLRCSSLAFASKIGSFQCFRPKRNVEHFSPNQWVLLSFIFFLFLHFFRCFSGQNGSFVLQIVQFSRTRCSYLILKSKYCMCRSFSMIFVAIGICKKWEKMKKRKEKRLKQSNGRKTKNQCDLPFCMPAPFCFLPYWYTCVL